jgi:FkbM family methyltransferase
MIVLDVGAHVGFFSVIAATLVGKEGMVCGFEPDPDNLRRSVANTRSYGWVRLYATAVSDSNGKTTFYRSPQSAESGWGTITNPDESRTSIQVAVTSLDQWQKDNGISRIDFVKMDAEGAEYRVLSGASVILRESRPILFLEINEVCLGRDGKSAEDIIRLLRNYSYWTGYVVDRNDAPQAVLAIPEEMKDVRDRIVRTVPRVRLARSQDMCEVLSVQ